MSDTSVAPPSIVDWHTLDVETVAERVSSDLRSGLDEQGVAEARDRYGPNRLEERGGKSPWRILWEQFTATLVLILLAAAALSAALGKLLEAGAILAIIILFALLGFFQEYRAERAIAALRQLSSPTVRVRRQSRTVEIDAGDVVVGDLVLLEAGSVVPADLRLVESASLRIQEAALTGESEPVDKQVHALDKGDSPSATAATWPTWGPRSPTGGGWGWWWRPGCKPSWGGSPTCCSRWRPRPPPCSGG